MKTKKILVAKFRGIEGKTCAYCGRPIKTDEAIRIGQGECEMWLHCGCYEFYGKRFRKGRVSKKSRSKNNKQQVPAFITIVLFFGKLALIVMAFACVYAIISHY